MNSYIKSSLKRKCSKSSKTKIYLIRLYFTYLSAKNKKRAEVLLRNSVRKICLSVKPTKEVLSGL